MDIPKERLEKYKNFVEIHSTNGKYDPEKGLEGLLSCITPDPKGIVLLSMRENQDYFSEWYLYKNVLNFLENVGAKKKTFPLTHPMPWSYCEFRDKKMDRIPGSLVNIGAVVKVSYYDTLEGLRRGYRISSAGQDLGKPLVLAAVNFVNKTQENPTKHTYDSMWRIFSGCHSSNEKRKQINVFYILKFLSKNFGKTYRCLDIQEELNLYEEYASKLLIELNETGIIDSDNPLKEMGGKRKRGWSKYILIDLKSDEETYGKLEDEIKMIGKNKVGKILNFIKKNPYQEFNCDKLSDSLGIHRTNISRVLSKLDRIKYLKNSYFKGGALHSKIKANSLTKLLYDVVLQPAEEIARTLNPNIINYPINPRKIENFLINYDKERSRAKTINEIGEIRSLIQELLHSKKEMKLNYIAEECNKNLDRKLNRDSYHYHLKILVEQGLVEKTKIGYYRLK